MIRGLYKASDAVHFKFTKESYAILRPSDTFECKIKTAQHLIEIKVNPVRIYGRKNEQT